MQSFTKAFNLDQKGKQLEFNIPQKKKNIFLRYPLFWGIIGFFAFAITALIIGDMLVPIVLLLLISTFMALLWRVEKLASDGKVFVIPGFLLSVFIIITIEVFLGDMLPPKLPFNMFLFSLICFSIVFLFKVKKAFATGKLKWKQGDYIHNFSHDPFLNYRPTDYRNDPMYSNCLGSRFYNHRSPFDS